MMHRHAVWGMVFLGIAGCGGSTESTVDVLAASSYTDVAEELETLLEDALGVNIRFSFGSSGTFFEQLNQGAPAAAVITANDETMRRLEAADLVGPSIAISRNELIIVTADTTIGQSIDSLADLAASGDAVTVVCASSAPCGAATDQMLEQTGLALAPASREPNVRATLTKVILGEADAAIVYRTDAQARPELRSVEIADAVDVANRAAAVTGNTNGANIIDVLGGPAAAEVLAGAGFLAP
jgi:molybdate transport system substrate-binding protein